LAYNAADMGNSHDRRKLEREVKRLSSEEAKTGNEHWGDGRSSKSTKGLTSQQAVGTRLSPQGKQPFNFGDSLGLLALIFAVLATVLAPPFWVKVVLLALCVPCIYTFANRSHWTHSWNPLVQNIMATVLVIIVSLIGVPQLMTQWKSEHPAQSTSAPDVQYPLPPQGRLQRVEASLEVPSSQLCVGMSDTAQINCLCPRPLKYNLTALPTPNDNNYATKVEIHSVREPIYKLRIFSRTVVSSGPISALPYGQGQAAVGVEEFAYDRLSLVMQSSKPETEYTIEIHSSEGLRLKCINQVN
jgi:hypothetical protein